MNERAIQTSARVHGTMEIPGSKSLTNRALVCAALADGASIIRGASDSDDSAKMANGLNQLGVLVRPSSGQWVVSGTGGRLFAPRFPIPVGNAGTTLRFLLSLSALAEGTTVFEGSARMAERPIEDLLRGLHDLGVEANFNPAQSRYTIQGGSLKGGTIAVKGNKSSQFLSSLLMAVPYAQGDTTIQLDGSLASASYVDLTLSVMKSFGIEPAVAQGQYRVRGGARYRACTFSVEPDASSASYAFGAAAIAGGEVSVRGLTRTSLQGDIGLLTVLEKMGCSVHEESDTITLQRTGPLVGVDVEMNTMPDVVPTIAAVALFAEGPTRVTGVGHLRHKESDRLGTLAEELTILGARVHASDDVLEISPGPLHGGVLDPQDDHRMAMVFALIGLRVPGVVVRNPGCVKKSFPKFWEELEKLQKETA
jgi:3-phosphoshikimate 1-carboxyvinyltransferase